MGVYILMCVLGAGSCGLGAGGGWGSRIAHPDPALTIRKCSRAQRDGGLWGAFTEMSEKGHN